MKNVDIGGIEKSDSDECCMTLDDSQPTPTTNSPTTSSPSAHTHLRDALFGHGTHSEWNSSEHSEPSLAPWFVVRVRLSQEESALLDEEYFLQ